MSNNERIADNSDPSSGTNAGERDPGHGESHTPGPWLVESMSTMHMEDVEVCRIEHARLKIVSHSPQGEWDPARPHRDARVMAASRELLAALESVATVNRADGPCFCVVHIPDGEAHHLTCQRARAAIAKARATAPKPPTMPVAAPEASDPAASTRKTLEGVTPQQRRKWKPVGGGWR